MSTHNDTTEMLNNPQLLSQWDDAQRAILADRYNYQCDEDPYTTQALTDAEFVALVQAEAPRVTTIPNQDFLQLHVPGVRDIGFISKGFIYFNNWDSRLCACIWHEYLRYLGAKHAQQRGPSYFASEADFVEALIRSLTADGWLCVQEVYTGTGRIDVLATREKAVRVIEAKLDNGTNAMTMALGQLLFAKQTYPLATLWVASPRPPKKKVLSILALHDVSYLPLERMN